jgi:hypothetical protein
VVKTDNKNLTGLKSMNVSKMRHLLWQEFLSRFHLRLEHVSGSQNITADYLSRLCGAVESKDFDEGCIEREDVIEEKSFCYRILVNKWSKKDKELRHFQISRSGGHKGVKGRLKLLTAPFSWRKVKKDVEEYTKLCPISAHVEPLRTQLRVPLVPLEVPSSPGKYLTMDLLSGLGAAYKGRMS